METTFGEARVNLVATQGRFGQVDEQFLSERLKESRRIVSEVAARTEKPLVVQFSGGRDSMAMLGLVREVTRDFVCSYMATGLEFPGVVQFVRETCEKLGVGLVISYPYHYKGNLFQRIETLKKFPIMNGPKWCCRDLKLRPQKAMLHQTFGKGTFYKLEGIRLAESSRRGFIYKDYRDSMMRPDGEHKGSFEVFPVLRWTNQDVLKYLEMAGLPTSGLYKKFGVSGCAWCPFYGPDIYRRVLAELPGFYDRYIEWEEKLGQPSVAGNIYLRDLKREVVEGTAPPARAVAPIRTPCMTMMGGRMVPTCEVYGHFFVAGKCHRCDVAEVQ